MGARITEINEHAITHVFRDETIKAVDRLGNTMMIGSNDLAEIFGIEARRQRGRPDQITEHDRKLAPLCLRGRWDHSRWRLGPLRYRFAQAQRCNCIEQTATMTNRGAAHLAQIIGAETA